MNKIIEMINECYNEKPFNRIAVIGIGSAKIVHDAFGPLTVSLLTQQFVASEKKCKYELFIYGDMSSPIHAVNFNEKIKEIKEKNKDALIIALDSCIPKKSHKEDELVLRKGGFRPGLGVDKDFEKIGDISMLYILRNVASENSLYSVIFNNMPLNEMYLAAKKASDILLYGLTEV